MLKRLSTRQVLFLLVFSIFCLLVCPKILEMGKNGDGTEYASIARNMSEGLGTFWAPYLDDTNWPVHWEHPPLIYWIQSIFFRLFGDGHVRRMLCPDRPPLSGKYGFLEILR
jgi:4-amino-4-deoxy-L-arabinose transferase-like glycosyltransferase